MKKIQKYLILTCLVMAMLSLSVTSFAASKKKTTNPVVSEDEAALASLQTYLNALVAMGASQADIDFAKQAIANQQAVIAAKAQKAAQEAAILAAGQAANINANQAIDKATQAAQSAVSAVDPNQQALLKQYYDALEKMQKKGINTPAQGLGVILVGDSRFVQMQGAAKGSGATFICENSKGYDWFVSEAIPRIDPLVTKGTKIVINLGVNDPGNIDKYIAMVNMKAAQWNAMGAKVYYATVNPVSENPYTSTEQVDYFNSKLIPGLVGVNIIDTNYYLKSTGYTLVDGLHYTDATYNNIYSYIISKL